MREFDRTYGGRARVLFVHGLECCVCTQKPSECHHVRSGGMGRKADADTIVPLCLWCHRRYHKLGKDGLLKWANREHGGLRLWNVARWRYDRYQTWESMAEAVEQEWRRNVL